MAIEWTTRTSRSDVRHIAKCKCRKAHSIMVTLVVSSTYRSDMNKKVHGSTTYEIAGEQSRHLPGWTCACSKTATYKPVKVTHNPDKACNARCLASTGPSCECACAGANHGANHG